MNTCDKGRCWQAEEDYLAEEILAAEGYSTTHEATSCKRARLTTLTDAYAVAELLLAPGCPPSRSFNFCTLVPEASQIRVELADRHLVVKGSSNAGRALTDASTELVLPLPDGGSCALTFTRPVDAAITRNGHQFAAELSIALRHMQQAAMEEMLSSIVTSFMESLHSASGQPLTRASSDSFSPKC